jgi:hypothetical protein
MDPPLPAHAQRHVDPHEAEARFRQLLADNDLPEPDEVEHRPGELLFLYHDRKLAVVVELSAQSSSSSS